jgi:hypothetical protein
MNGGSTRGGGSEGQRGTDSLLQDEIENRLLEHLGIDFEPDLG